MHLIVGGDSKLGIALRNELTIRVIAHAWTSRRWKKGLSGGGLGVHLDLLHADDFVMPNDLRVLYLVAAVPKFADCERDPATWQVNVDAPIALAMSATKAGAFVVFVSSDAVECCSGTAYARQKAHAEMAMRFLGAAIVRPSRIAPDGIAEVARVLVSIGIAGKPSLTRWQAI